ncbi:MAG: 4Fe-4S binding protein [Pseudomonadales bacterium]|nr:4Fe-4S binding protein [Pseudomonadales bacterium]
MLMLHLGLSDVYALIIISAIMLMNVWFLFSSAPSSSQEWRLSLSKLPLAGPLFTYMMTHTWVQLSLKIMVAATFLLIMAAGVFGTQIASKNIATVLTWNIWWTCIVFIVFFVGTSWCGVCPWDTFSNVVARQKFWLRSKSRFLLNITVPKSFRNVWLAFVFFLFFTWLEIGFGLTDDPFNTAMLCLFISILAIGGMLFFEDRAFCRYACPVGRTIGFYSQLSPVELRAIDPDICKECKSLACYHGTDTVQNCTSNLVVGRMKESTYCTSCGNCTQSCPEQNVSWRLRPISSEAKLDARPHMDESIFIIGLLSTTMFHAFTMLPIWEPLLLGVHNFLGGFLPIIFSFTLILIGFIALPILLFWVFVKLTQLMWFYQAESHAKKSNTIAVNIKRTLSLSKLFSGFAFTALPLAFFYHLAHNLNHLMRENTNFIELLGNPFGFYAKPFNMMEKHEQMMNLVIPQDVVGVTQTVLMIVGFWITLQVIRYRGYKLYQAAGFKLLPILLFANTIILFNVWMMVQPMAMRM